MSLDTLSIQAIRSISLRHLTVAWQKLGPAGQLRRLDDFNSGHRSHDPQRIVVWTVKEQGGVRKFSPTFKGAHIIEAFGQRVYFEMIASETLRKFILSGLEDCAASRAAIYMILEAPDTNGQPIECERLLLPFGEGGEVKHIFAAIEPSSRNV